MDEPMYTLDSGEQAIQVGDVDRLDFTTDVPQMVIERGQIAVVRFVAPCIRDQRRTYSVQSRFAYTIDPSVMLGEHYAAMVSSDEYDADLVGPDVAICWECYNNSGGDVHAEAVALAVAQWKPKPPMIDVGGKEFKRTPVEGFWDAERDAGGDGYDTMSAAQKHQWLAVANWGRDGWDFLEWPYYVGYVRNTSEGFEFATNCEGDVDWYVFPTQERRMEHMNRLAFWNWQLKEQSWVQGIHPDEIPEKFKGFFDWERTEREKD